MEQTIYDNQGEKYMTLKYDEERGIIKMRMHRYDPEVIYVNFDQKAIPELMSFLELVRSK